MGKRSTSAASRPAPTGARITAGKNLFASGGRWAGERMLRAMTEGRQFSAGELRTLDTLRKDEWRAYDEAVVREGTLRLRAVADLIGAGLTIPIPNGLGKTILQWETITDMDEAGVSLDGLGETDNDNQEFDLNSLPLPITHKDFFLSLRHLSASRERGEPLDVTQAGTAGRVVSEKVESVLFNGLTGKFGGASIYGYCSHPSRLYCKYGDSNNPWSNSGKTGAEILDDVLAAIAALQRRRFFGPYAIYVSPDIGVKLEADFKDLGSLTIRQRILQVDGVRNLTVADQMPANTVVIVQLTRDVVALVEGEPLQTIQWDMYGGMRVNFKVMTIQVPLIRATASGRCGVMHIGTGGSEDFADVTDVD